MSGFFVGDSHNMCLVNKIGDVPCHARATCEQAAKCSWGSNESAASFKLLGRFQKRDPVPRLLSHSESIQQARSQNVVITACWSQRILLSKGLQSLAQRLLTARSTPQRATERLSERFVPASSDRANFAL